MKERSNSLLPTRSQLAEITRAFNKAYPYLPVTLVFKYQHYIALSNSERTQYQQAWRSGEKVGKVTILRDINLKQVHEGHNRILQQLAITRSGKNGVNSFKELHKYWKEVFSVSILNKSFYKELSNWYFWAIKEVNFPNNPLRIDSPSDEAYEEALKEHKGKNVIRLLTRILFIWFIKEKNLIPEEIFDEKIIAEDFIADFTPQKPHGVFATGKHNSQYYRAILQNLFFATLNQTRGKREFRKEGHQHQNITQLMRYQSYLKNPKAFINLMEKTVPFMNGGLFECLDKPHPTAKGKQGGDRIIYVDGFSDKADNVLQVPDFLFFDAEETVDLSDDYNDKKFKTANTKGLINILKSYKFTITENTPIDEEVALDPELLGKVFENLLASYNPETKTTARKQTGSFYTPREIVNYMVDESLVAYLKNELENKSYDGNLEEKLHELVSFGDSNPFDDEPEFQRYIIEALDDCKILDPACGSGAYPMGILQKMVHILHKIDPNNNEWKQRQIDKVEQAIELLEDTPSNKSSITELQKQIKDIEGAFNNNELDYARKLFLIENCIYGVDIQPIATQISKLRFFISLVVDQKVDAEHENFGIRPLPNLEAKFVAANTLIGIDKPVKGKFTGSLFDKKEIDVLEKQLKNIRHKIFSIKSPGRKRELREQDRILREQIGDLLIADYGNDTAKLLASWDPYDQNISSPFYDTEWMFGLSKKNGGFFDIVIGNPPYGVSIKGSSRKTISESLGKVPDFEIYYYFIELANTLLKTDGIKAYIIPNTFLFNVFASEYRKRLLNNWDIFIIDCTAFNFFEGATVFNAITIFKKSTFNDFLKYKITSDSNTFSDLIKSGNGIISKSYLIENNQNWCLVFKLNTNVLNLISKIKKGKRKLQQYFPEISQGLIAYDKYQGQTDEIIKSRAYHYQSNIKPNLKKWLWGSDVNRFSVVWNEREWIDYCDGIANPRNPKFFKNERLLVREITNPSIFCGFTDQELYHDPANIVILKGGSYSLKVLLAILNSKLATYYHFNSSPKATKGAFPKILVEDIKNFPLPEITEQDQSKLTSLVNRLLDTRGSNSTADVNHIEWKLDEFIFKLYNLTFDEIKLVEPNFLELVEEEVK
ncbi:Eco57I restriction-modification methylase domain-containing protein [Mucilaginibacter rubeus]|uniref:Eco57I restriction-modification methylase domain-containing protein n=1 Tax=Mucilaginibacter rubeus TaxID=2027860 RepID=UPI001AAF0321|nr:TaqI-like C-terminal specificity domain-containing protein [Mucilaginibacter rubeus]QTF62277.1 N-6 DNA methylase [Mucilaginibacter rubeus]